MKDFYNKKYYETGNTQEQKTSTKNYLRLLRLMKLRPKNLLDVGCGRGIFVKTLIEWGINAVGMDFSEDAGVLIPGAFVRHDATEPFPFKDKSFDIVFSSAFFEHLKEEDVDKVYQEMQRVGEKVMALIGYKSKVVDGVETHLTIHNKAWWEKKLPGAIILG